jgi:hypothetical protein
MHVSKGEYQDVSATLPADLKELFGDPHRESEADAPLDAGTQRGVSSDG